MPITDMNAVPMRTNAMAMPAPQGAAPDEPDVQGQPDEPDMGVDTSQMQQASPEEQQQADRFVGRAMQLIYNGGKINPAIADILDGGSGDGAQGDPTDGLAQATALVTARVAGAAEQSGVQLSPDVLYNAGSQIYEDLAHASKALGIKDYTQDKDAFQRGWFKALDIYRGLLQDTGELDQQHAQGDMQKFQQLDQAGQLDPLFRKLAANDSAASPTPASAPAPRRRGLGG